MNIDLQIMRLNSKIPNIDLRQNKAKPGRFGLIHVHQYKRNAADFFVKF